MTKIEWTDESWNPVIGYPQDNPFRVTVHGDKMEQPLHWRKPRMVFVCPMSDLFHPDVSSQRIALIFDVMGAAKQHIFQVLTKRPERMKELPLRYPNVWLGTSCENQPTADERIPHLLKCPVHPSAVRFLSLEPLLEEINIYDNVGLPVVRSLPENIYDTPRVDLGVDWVIVGCESGPGARPMDLDWVRSIRDQCRVTGVPLFVKQLRLNGKLVKDIDAFPLDLQIREFPNATCNE